METPQGTKSFQSKICYNSSPLGKKHIHFNHIFSNNNSIVSYQGTLGEENVDWPLDIDDLLKFSFEVAQGLDFLAAKNVSYCAERFLKESIWSKTNILN